MIDWILNRIHHEIPKELLRDDETLENLAKNLYRNLSDWAWRQSEKYPQYDIDIPNKEKIKSLLLKMPFKRRRLLFYRHVTKLSNKDIADKLSLSVGHVSTMTRNSFDRFWETHQ